MWGKTTLYSLWLGLQNWSSVFTCWIRCFKCCRHCDVVDVVDVLDDVDCIGLVRAGIRSSQIWMLQSKTLFTMVLPNTLNHDTKYIVVTSYDGTPLWHGESLHFQNVKLCVYHENQSREVSYYFSISPIRLVQENDLPSVGLSAKLAKLLGLVTIQLN